MPYRRADGSSGRGSKPTGQPTLPYRRHVLATLLACATATSRAGGARSTVEVWVELSEPPPVAAGGTVERSRQAERVSRQQTAITGELRRLGAIELARVRHAGNAIAVRIEADRLDAVRALPGVLHVRPAEDLHPPRTSP